MKRFRTVVGSLLIGWLLCCPRIAIAQAAGPGLVAGLPRLTLARPAVRLLFAFPTHLRQLTERALLPALDAECAATAVPTEVSADSFPAIEQAARDSGFVIAAAPGAWMDGGCRGAWDNSSIAIWRGLSLATPGPASAAPAHLALIVDGDTIAPIRSFEQPAFALADGKWVPAAHRLAVVFPISALSRHGADPERIEVVVWDASGRFTPVVLDAAQTALSALEVVAAMLAGVPARSGPTFPLAVSHPIAPDVRAATREAASGSVMLAAARSARWLADAAPLIDTSANAAVSRLLIAEGLARVHETKRASVFAAAALADRPCASVPEASAIVTEVTSRRASLAACQPVDPTATLVQGLLLSGGGHRSLHGRATGVVVGLASLVAITSGVLSLRSAQHTYEAYQRSTGYAEATSLYGNASAKRRSGSLQLVAGVGLWVGDALLARFIATLHNRAVVHDHL